jgi:hypothetical protein
LSSFYILLHPHQILLLLHLIAFFIDLAQEFFSGKAKQSIFLDKKEQVKEQSEAIKADKKRETAEKVQFSKNETFAKLRGYKCDFSTAKLKVDTVELTTPYFTTPILGKLQDLTTLDLGEGEKSPQFNSYEKRLKIPNLRDQMDYDGGFTLEGPDFIGRGTAEKPAKIILKNL